jgi:hypothetical protein
MSHIAIASASTSATEHHNRETTRTSTLIPEQLVEKASGLIHLLEDYYNYLNTNGLPSREINLIVDNHDIDRVSAKYLDSIGSEIAKNVPNSKVLDQVSLYKKIVKFYSIRGSEDSLYAFFRIFFDEYATVTYPKEKLFKLSEGDWEPSNIKDEVQLVGNLLSGKLTNESLNTIFQIKDDSNTVLGEGQLSNYVNVDKEFDYDNITDGMVMGFDSKQNTTNTNWISISDYPWVGTFENGLEYQSETQDIRFDGSNDYISIGNRGTDIPITDEHTIVARIRREDSSGYRRQNIFSATEKGSPFEAHELYIKAVNGKVGRWWNNIGNPMIKESGDNISVSDFKTTTNFYGDLSGIYYKNTAYASNTGLYNGKPFYVDTNVFYTNGTTFIHNTYLFDENTGFGTPNNWPCAVIYYDGNKWVFKGARRYTIESQVFGDEGVVLCYSEDTGEDVFTADIEWFNDYSTLNAFVNTPVHEYGFIFANNTSVPSNGKYYTVAMTGKKARKGGYVKVSVDGNDWETIISGDTSVHLNITDQTPINIGRWTGNRYFFKGVMSNIQYYNTSLTPAQVLQVYNYYLAVAYNFYQIEFDNQDGSFINGSTLIEKNDQAYTLNLLTGHTVDSFWTFDEPALDESGFGPTIRIEATYTSGFANDKQKVMWGDLRSDLFTSGNQVQHIYSAKDVGSYNDRRSFASDVNKLHDGDFWQEFSYVVNVALSSNQWENEFIRMVHPAGLKFFAAVLYILNVDNNWIGPKVEFDQALRQYKNTFDPTQYKGNYRTNDPLTDLKWMEGLTPPSILNADADAYHMPLFQPGWLTGDLRFLELIIEAFEFDLGPNDPAYQRMVLSTLHLLHRSTKDRNAFAREDYLENIKFLDQNPITPYLNTIFEEAVFNNSNIFNNLGALIDLSIIENLRLNTEILEDIETEDDQDYLIK